MKRRRADSISHVLVSLFLRIMQFVERENIRCYWFKPNALTILTSIRKLGKIEDLILFNPTARGSSALGFCGSQVEGCDV